MTTKTKRSDAYIARLVVSIPLDLKDGQSYAKAVEAVAKIGITIPNAMIDVIAASLGKMSAGENPKKPDPLDIPESLKRK